MIIEEIKFTGMHLPGAICDSYRCTYLAEYTINKGAAKICSGCKMEIEVKGYTPSQLGIELLTHLRVEDGRLIREVDLR